MHNWQDEIRRRLAPHNLRPTREQEIVEELAQHLEDRYQELQASGTGDAQAREIAWRELDEQDVLGKEIARVEKPAPLQLPPPGGASRGRWLNGLAQDVRQALRTIRTAPGFAATMILALALSIGPATAIISIGNWLVWRPHPGVTDSGRLAVIWTGEWTPTGGVSPRSLTYADLAALSSRAPSLAGLAGFQELDASFSAPGALPVRTATAHVTGNFFDVLGVHMRAGRPLNPGDEREGGAPIAVLGEALARRTFGSPEAAIGQVIRLNSRPYTVTGVAADAFRGATPTTHVEIWVPGASYGYLNHMQSAFAPRFYQLVARLPSGASFDGLERELSHLIPLLDSDPAKARFTKTAARVYPGFGVHPLMRARTTRTVNIMAAVGAVLVILGCANVANLLVFRATRRQHELAVRKALGATRGRLVRTAIIESCVMATFGAAAGLGLAWLLKDLIQSLLFPAAPGAVLAAPIDMRVLVGALGLAWGTGVIAAVAPSWMAVRRDITPGTRQGTRGATSVPHLRGGLAVVQLALSLSLLVGALLLVTTLKNLRLLERGFNPDGVTAFSVTLDSHGYKPPQALQYLRTAMESLEQHGEFQLVAANATGLRPNFILDVTHPGKDAPRVEVAATGVTHKYFETLETPLLSGRGFTPEEAMTSDGTPPVVVNRALAMQLFGTADVLGRLVRIPAARNTPPKDMPIIGVITDTHPNDVTDAPKPYLYQPIGRYRPVRWVEFVVRSDMPSARVGSAAATLLSRIDPAVPFASLRPLTYDIDRELSQQRLFAWVLSLLAALGFVLAAFGLYGLISQTAAERRREFGIRLAIGARGGDIVRLIAGYALLVSAAGIAAGLAIAYWGTRMIESMLHGVTRLDTSLYVTAIATLVAVVAIACIVPVLRALRVQPVEVLRAE